MSLHSILSLIVLVATLCLGIFVFYKKRKSASIAYPFLLLSVNLCIYLSFVFVIFTTENKEFAHFFARFGCIGVIFAPIALYHFVINFYDIQTERKFLVPIYIYGLIMSIICFVQDIVIRDMRSYYWGYYGIGDYGMVIIGIIFSILFIRSNFLLFMQLKNKDLSEIKHHQTKYLLAAFIVLFTAGIEFLTVFGVEIYPMGYLIFFVMLVIIAYAIIKYRLMDIRVAITRAGIFLIVYALVLGVPFWIGFHTKNWLISTLSMFFLSTTGPIIYRYFQGKAENLILANQRHYQRLLLESAKGMLRVHDLDKLLRFITDIVIKIVKVRFAIIVLKDSSKRSYILKAIKGDKNFPRDFVLPDKDPLIKFLKKRKSSLMYDEINYYKKNIVNKQIQLIVPILMENNLLGFLCLGEKEDRTLYTQDDINVFEILARQAALAIDHCHFMEEFSKAQEKAFQAEKLASIGGMADGVAHQMKNRLNLFSIVSGEMRSEIEDFTKAHPELVEQNPDLKRYFDYLSKTGEMLISNVRKTNGIIEGILSFARAGEKGAYFSEFSFAEIIDASIGLLLIKHQIKEFPLEVIVDSCDLIYGVKSQFLECIYNILDNCYEAIKEKMDFYLTDYEKKSFKPSIKLKLSHNEKFYHIEISDNGTGIKEENRQKIFAPFFTTKPSNKSGSGVGMYVVKRIIEENHKGKIKFESKYMEGTKFFIRLPKNMGEDFKSSGQLSN
ncbi:MAG: ATP-binding protein [bacterium]